MASTSITLKDAADVDNIFSLVGQTARQAEYIDTDTSLMAPLRAVVTQNPAQPGAIANDRGDILISRTVVDDNGKAFTGNVRVTFSTPRTEAWGATQTRDLFAYARNYITDARVQMIEDGIIP